MQEFFTFVIFLTAPAIIARSGHFVDDDIKEIGKK
jgi:hypothetical protein